MLTELKRCDFANGRVAALQTSDGYLVETTDTFLPYYTKDAIGRHQNVLDDHCLGSRAERWMIGVSVMSGCPVHCQFCATGQMKRCRNLTADEIVGQLIWALSQHHQLKFSDALEHKVNYTRMGEPFLNITAVREAIATIDRDHPGTHHYVSTIGVAGSDFSWITGNVSLQLSVHSLDEDRRNELIPMKRKMTLEELGQIRTSSNLKTTVNMTLVDTSDFDIERLRQIFDPEHFFIKLSPINPNNVSEANGLGFGVISANNIV